MTAIYNSSLSTILAAATSKTDWANKLQAALGNTLRLRMFHDTASNAVDPTVTGTEFLNVGVTGPMTVVGANITGWGTASNTTIRLPADLLTGTSALLLQGNGNSLRLTLGLTRGKQSALGVADANLQDYDYELFEQPSAASGIGFISGTGIKAPLLLPSGTGPLAPDLDANAPASYAIGTFPVDDTEANVVMSAKAYINIRDADIVFDRPYIASQVGDVRRMRSADGAGIVIGTGGDCFRFAPTLLVSNGVTNATDTSKPVYDLRFLATPHGRWPGFPFRGNFDITTDTLAPNSFKIYIYRANGSLLDVIEMYSTRVNNVPGTGKPINSRTQNIVPENNAPVQPWWTCQMSLRWSSADHIPSKYIHHFHPGVEATALDVTNVTAYDAWPNQWPILDGNFLANGQHAYRVCPKWSRALGTGADTTTIDTLFINVYNDNYRTQQVGYGYEPGSTGQHCWFMSPGGQRHDRSMWSDITVRWICNQNGIRVHGAVPYKELQKNWNYAYHNEGCHYVTNPELGATLNKNDVLYGLDCYNDAYYNGGDENYRPNLATTAIRLLTYVNAQHSGPYTDKNGRIFTNQYQRDVLHNISNAAQMLYLNNDPMGALESRDSFNSNMLCSWDQTQGFNAGDFLERQHAWQIKHLVENWVVASNDPNGFTSAEMEFMTKRHLEWVYDAIIPMVTATTGVGMIAKAIRDLGTNSLLYTSSDGTTATLGLYDSKAFYFSNIMMFAKQTGWYDRMHSLSSKCATILEFMITCLCKNSVDFFIDGGGRLDKNLFSDLVSQNTFAYEGFNTASPPVTLDWNTAVPANGALDWLHNADGTIGGYDSNKNPLPNYPEGYNTQHNRAAWLWVMKYFYPEFAYPRLDAAITKVHAWYDIIEAQKNAGGNNWHWRYTNMAIPLSPDSIGAPALS